MATIISIHSFHGDTGKSNATANIAALLAATGRRVGVVDTGIQSPGVHVLFGLDEDHLRYTLDDYLWGACAIRQAAYNVTARLDVGAGGQLFLIPSRIKADANARVPREGHDVCLLNDGFHSLITDLELDVLLIDTDSGLNEETLLAITISDALAIVLCPHQQDYQGTGVTVAVARRLEVPRIALVVNKVPALCDAEAVKARVEAAYTCPVAAVLPHSDELMVPASAGIFALSYPDHPVTAALKQVAAMLVG
jgi:MinD-like ATPase involved in chromosome partitioning or flagellar assembly